MDIYNSYTWVNDAEGKSFEDYTREACFENYGEDEGWETAADVPEERVQEAMSFDLEQQMDDFKANMAKWFDDGKVFVLTGSCGTWHGRSDGGCIVRNIHDFFRIAKDCDYIAITDEAGRLKIRCSHHDGTNYAEVRMLTDRGKAWLEKHEECDDRRTVCETLFNKPHMSVQPHYAKTWFGTEDKRTTKKEASK